MHTLLQLLLALNFFLFTHGDGDFLGCGGFIQVPTGVGLDLTKAEIRLYTKQGNLKYHTDCAPNNGYYFIPIYDNGEYVIKISNPDGWSFEPSAVAINIDGTSDLCSLGKDINFLFKGFSVTGKVTSHGKAHGPSGVSLDLYTAENALLQSGVTGLLGNFEFHNVLPGAYQIKASHPSWRLVENQVEVNVKSDSVVVLEKGLEVLGYQVQGQVFSDGEPIQGVIFSIYSDVEDVSSNCGLEPVPFTVLEGNWRLICQTVSDLSGQFLFPVVASGNYKLVPLYHGENIKFDIRPSTVDLQVEDNSVTLPQKFEVQGFRVSGRVLQHPNGQGLPNAKIYLNNKLVTVTGEGGFYNLENIQTGIYHLTAESDDLGYEKLSVRISPNTPYLPDMSASSYKVCGQIHLEDLPVARQIRQVIFLPIEGLTEDAEPVLVSTDLSGVFCHLLKPAVYKLEPMAFEAEVAAGLKFVPSSYRVEVAERPVSGFQFSQFRASIKGSISVISPASDVAVSIQLTGSTLPTQTVMTSSATDGTFQFDKLLPGKYTLSLLPDGWCWKSKSIDVELVDRDVEGVSFDQIGFFMTAVSSHEVDAAITLNGREAGSLHLKAGGSKHCLEHGGHYLFRPESSCHVFEPAEVEWSSDSPLAVALNAVKHRIGFVVESDQIINDLSVTATPSNGGEVIHPVKDVIDQGSSLRFRHHFSFDAAAGQTFQVVPSADSLLFFPASLNLQIRPDCDPQAGTILAQKGLYLTGSISPPIADVRITITGQSLSDPAVVLTDAQGSYSYGPINLDGHPILDLAAAFSVQAEKKGYVIHRKDQGHFGDFVAEKLAEILIRVVDHADQPLSGVLVAAAGGVGYRQNSRTAADGLVTLSELSPGDYFIKPVLKEYRFDPVSKLIHIDDGATVEMTIVGQRVSFSCFGSVTSLNGEPELGVGVEAVGLPGGSCAEFQEEASTEASGQFRLRGLIPQCEYIVRMKSGNGFNKNIQRTLPPSQIIKMESQDISGLRFMAIKSVNQADVVVTVAVEDRDYLKTVKINLFREDQPDAVVHSLKMDSSSLVILPVLPMDGRKYFLQLESTLGRHTYEYSTPEVTFSANTSVQHVRLEFSPKRKISVESETTQVSLRSILFVLLCGAGAYYYQALTPLISRLFILTATAIKASKESSSNNFGTSSGNLKNVEFSEQELALMEVEPTIIKRKVKPRRAQ